MMNDTLQTLMEEAKPVPLLQPSYSGPAMWVRIQHRFGARMMEWFLAAHVGVWGLVLLSNDHVFDQPAFAGFRAIFGQESVVGWFMVFMGALRVGGLIVNGARKHVTPIIRQVSAGIGCMIWVGISYCYASSNVFSTWLAIYPLFALGELVNIHRAAHDQGEAKRGTPR